MAYPPLSATKRESLIARQQQSRFFDADTGIPDWAWRRWHFHPDGYFTERALNYYEWVIVPLYNHARERRLHDAIAFEVRAAAVESLLEIGCGPGHGLRRVRDALPGVALAGVDIAPLMLERASRRLNSKEVALFHRDASVGLDGVPPAAAIATMHVLAHTPGEIAAGIIRTGAAFLPAGGCWFMLEHSWHDLPAMPPGFRLVQRRELLGGLHVLRVYRKSS